MAVFRYLAFDAAGRRQRGLIEGDSAADARERLRTRELFASKVSPCETARGAAGPPQSLWTVFHRDRSTDLAVPLRELAALLSAGVALVQALEALARESEDAGVGSAMRGLRERVLRGESLSVAAAAYPRYFGPVARNMMAAGEAVGDLDATLRRLSEGLRRRREIKGKVASALVYPAILSAVSLAVVVFLLTYVVPRISALYAQTGATLPLPTRMLLKLSSFSASWWLPVTGAALLLCILGRLSLRSDRLATAWDLAKLRMPFIGSVFRKRCVTVFAATLHDLLEAGVPLVEALRVTAGTVGNRVFQREVERAAVAVELGAEASKALRRKGVFPETVAELMAAGEESGELASLLGTLAEDYEHQLGAAAERACRAMEPLVVVVMGSVVLFIVLAVLLPIVRMSQLVRF